MQSNQSAITSFADSPLTIAYMKGEEVNIQDLKKQMDSAIAEWRFEDAAVIRDQIKELEE